jgi:hypothetical protein
MIRLPLALVLIAVAGTAAAQTKPPNPPTAAAAKTRIESLHYKGVHDLRRGPDGQWVGKATQGNVEKTVTVTPSGTVIAR